MAGNFSISGFRLSGRYFAEMAKMAIVYFRLPTGVLGGDIFADSVCKRRFQRRLCEGPVPGRRLSVWIDQKNTSDGIRLFLRKMEYFRPPAALRVRGKRGPRLPFPRFRSLYSGGFCGSRYQVLPISRRLSEEVFHGKAKKDFYSFGGTGACGRGGTPKAPPFCPYLVGEADEKIKVSPFSAGFR